jgi:hypothetical protein
MQESAPVVKATPSLHSVNAQSRNLQHPNWEVRAEAADFFGGLGSESVILVVPVLQELLLKDDSWHVRQHAADALQDLGPEAVAMAAPTLQRVTQEDGHYTVRLAAAVALRKFGHKAEAALPLAKYDDFGANLVATGASTSSTGSPPLSTSTKCSSMDQDAVYTPPKACAFNDDSGEQLPDISEISAISPPREHMIVLDRGITGKWGIDVDFVVSGTCLRVSRLKDGAISQWNEEHPESAVEVGDLLMELNGVSGDSKELVKIICKADRLEMLVQKCS